MNRRFVAILVASAVIVGGVALASPRVFTSIVQRPAGATGTIVVPDRFLRSWDPITVFFAGSTGPGAGPEDHPERFVSLQPAQPGAWTWVDGKTLQFEPAEPWPPLSKTTVTVAAHPFELTTLMSPPVMTIPAANSEGLDPVESVVLVFADALDERSLARMVAIELRPLPGIGDGPARWLNKDDFTIKRLEAIPAPVVEEPEETRDTGYSYTPEPVAPQIPDGGAAYELRLDHPIGAGTRAIVRFQLSIDGDAGNFAEIPFATAEPFRAKGFGCPAQTVPIPPSGTTWTADQALTCAGTTAVVVDFSSRPDALGPLEARNLVRFEPAVDGLAYDVSGNRLTVTGRFDQEVLYRVRLEPTALHDSQGRPLDMTGPSAISLFFPRKEAFLAWGAGDGLVERYGPQTVPVSGRGFDSADLRVIQIDPLDRSFFPYPSSPIAIDESVRPAGPGEEVGKWDVPQTIPPAEIAVRIHELEPGRSTLVKLPLRPEGAGASFGLDLSEHLAYVGGKKAPGSYLVGLRALDTSTTRSWMRVDVTDLSLAAVEEADTVRFVVTSLSTGAPVAGADLRIDGIIQPARGSAIFTTLATAKTDGNGTIVWTAPGKAEDVYKTVVRVVVEKGDDTLVLDASNPPPSYTNGHWGTGGAGWLAWAFENHESRHPAPSRLCHLFSERPVYRPEETVHLKGWARTRDSGRLTPLTGGGVVTVSGPGDLIWTYDVTTTSEGGFDVDFAQDDLPTGIYTASYAANPTGQLCTMTFDVEAYRVPTFEVTLSGPATVPLDAPFTIDLAAKGYAGGKLADRPVRWRVTQYPYTWSPQARPGFVYSSDGRYSGVARFDATPTFEKAATTNEEGSAKLVLDPTIEPTAQPRTYVVEATVTGDDDQTVTDVQRVIAVPPFVLGVKLARYVEKATSIRPLVLVAGPDGAPVANQPVTVRLFNRQWHSHLQAGDFSDAEARYVTDVVDDKISETTVISGADAVPVELATPRAGVYVVELESRDKLGRAQVVRVDLYVGGDEAVAWEKPQAGTFTLSPDKTSYDPDQSAKVVMHSPFQDGSAIVVVESPAGNRYDWVPVRGGVATATIPILDTYVPRLPVHVLLLRGRVDGTGPIGASSTDLGKPQSVAATVFLTVNPVENRLKVAIDAPAKAMPGQTVPVTVTVTDAHGEPHGGELALWLVDAAVLALGTEQRLDPVPDFITDVTSRMLLRDTRNLAFGRIPFAEMPGGDGEEEAADEEIGPPPTVRKNFSPVPYWKPSLVVPATGKLTVQVQLPDNLTVFKLRAKVASGQRFGYATGEMAVRLPVIVEPALPRFVRPGDSFVAAGIGRVIEGDGGAAKAELVADGLSGSKSQSVTLDTIHGARVAFPVTVDPPALDANGDPVRDSVKVQIRLKRTADGAGDAFELTLPIRPDQRPVAVRQLADLAGKPVDIAAIPEAARAGSLRRSITVSDRPSLLRMAAGMDFFLEYPYGSTEQKVSKARAYLAMGKLRDVLAMPDGDARTKRAVNDVLAGLPAVIDGNGLVADWPGNAGSVTRTAWTVDFLVEAKTAGYAVDDAEMATLLASLRRALKSDYGHFVTGESFTERTMALEALSAAGNLDAGYFAELSRQARVLDTEALAAVVIAGSRGGAASGPTASRLATTVGDGVIVQLFQGKEIYGGLQAQRTDRNPLIWPSETRSVAMIARALTLAKPDDTRLPVLEDALVRLGRDDGWGSTNANAAAMLALADIVSHPTESRGWSVTIGTDTIDVDAKHPVGTLVTTTGTAVQAKASAGAPPAGIRVETRYTPAADGAYTAAVAHGLVVARSLEHVAASGPWTKQALTAPAQAIALKVGDIVEDHVQVVVPANLHYVAITIPLAAGVEALNPALATAPPEARPSTGLTLAPTYTSWRDDEVMYVYDSLPKGTYEFAFRAQATVEGTFVQPSAYAEAMYDSTLNGRSNGASVQVSPK
jgi:uncharacterized protein YfaS (alpha-2-macroglobulin family)